MEQRAPTRPYHKLMLPHMVNKEGVHRNRNLGGRTTRFERFEARSLVRAYRYLVHGWLRGARLVSSGMWQRGSPVSRGNQWSWVVWLAGLILLPSRVSSDWSVLASGALLGGPCRVQLKESIGYCSRLFGSRL